MSKLWKGLNNFCFFPSLRFSFFHLLPFFPLFFSVFLITFWKSDTLPPPPEFAPVHYVMYVDLYRVWEFIQSSKSFNLIRGGNFSSWNKSVRPSRTQRKVRNIKILDYINFHVGRETCIIVSTKTVHNILLWLSK